MFLLVLVGGSLFASNADALRVSVNPSVTFRSSNRACYQCPQRVVTTTPVMEVRSYVDPRTGYEYFYEQPVYERRVVNYYYPPQYYRSTGTDFQLRFNFR